VHALNLLENRRIRSYRLALRITEGKKVDRFEISLVNAENRVSKPFVEGRYFRGTELIKTWMEIDYNPRAEFDGGAVDLPKESLDEALFKMLSELIPPGGHLTVKYLSHRATAKGLAAGVPPPATPLGFLLWKAGFRWFKDWYFPEGWMEGDQKLQGNKPLDEEHDKKRREEAAEELEQFLRKRGEAGDLDVIYFELAEKVLKSIKSPL